MEIRVRCDRVAAIVPERVGRDIVIDYVKDAMKRRTSLKVGKNGELDRDPAALTLDGASIRSGVVDGVPIVAGDPKAVLILDAEGYHVEFQGEDRFAACAEAVAKLVADKAVAAGTVREMTFKVAPGCDVTLLVRGPVCDGRLVREP
jgi:hypothetical protein